MANANTITSESERPVTEFPFYWFALFEQAIEKGDLAEALRAQQELARFGMRVKYLPLADTRKAVDCAQ